MNTIGKMIINIATGQLEIKEGETIEDINEGYTTRYKLFGGNLESYSYIICEYCKNEIEIFSNGGNLECKSCIRDQKLNDLLK